MKIGQPTKFNNHKKMIDNVNNLQTMKSIYWKKISTHKFFPKNWNKFLESCGRVRTIWIRKLPVNARPNQVQCWIHLIISRKTDSINGFEAIFKYFCSVYGILAECWTKMLKPSSMSIFESGICGIPRFFTSVPFME